MTHIYTVTALTKDSLKNRCFGFFFNETDARVTCFNNHGDLQECLYQHLVIEKQSDGIHSPAEVIQWYKWIGEDSLSESDGRWVECERPDFGTIGYLTNFNEIG